jgi:FkbM family methyltransferase
MTTAGRIREWLSRSPREWRWAVRRRLNPRGRYTVPFDGDLCIEVWPEDELSLRYALGMPFEPDVWELLDRLLRPGMSVLDVGANIGHYTLMSAKRVGLRGSVHAFEPAPLEFAKLTANVVKNGFRNVFARQLAVADEDGPVDLHLAGRGLGLYNSLGFPLRQDHVERITVPCVTLDSYLRSQPGLSPHLVKIDVEGAELKVLQGAAATLSAQDAPMIICEFSDLTGDGLGHSTSRLREVLETYGYEAFRYDLAVGALVAEPHREHYEYANLLCVKQGHKVSLDATSRSPWPRPGYSGRRK